jgi:hypothetical protein
MAHALKTGCGDLSGGISQHPLDGLEFSNWGAKSLTLLRITQGFIQRSLGQADCQRPDADPATVQGDQRLAQAIPLLPKQ